MRKAQIEAKVISTIDSLMAGSVGEDDLVECKRDWPPPDKARQLAAWLNRAAGERVVYIIGFDEKEKAFHPPAPMEVANWWATMTSPFDQVKPELIDHLNVVAGPNGEQVVALVISAERAPYVIKSAGGGGQLEVPIREGTRTRSAHRDELLRLLIPAVGTPTCLALKATVYASFEHMYNVVSGLGEDRTRFHGHVNVFFEHHGGVDAVFPTHSMRGQFLVNGTVMPIKVKPPKLKQQDTGRAPAIEVVPDAMTVSRSGAGHLSFEVDDLPIDLFSELRLAEQVQVSLTLELLRGTRPVQLALIAVRGEDGITVEDDGSTYMKWEFHQ
jgi:catechol 2,3-dioxygenase-like lactoylglutathione lyase family enzyme